MRSSALRIGKLRIISAILLILISVELAAQKEGNIAIFGFGAGLDFNKTPPEAFFVPSNFQSYEGSASIADKTGRLLFYTNGVDVWNANHVPMPNTGGISGSEYLTTTTQIQIVPIPKDPYRYYIFTVGYQGGDLMYSMVDMRLDGGNGDVVFKGVVLYRDIAEKLAVVKSADENALWLITHEVGNNIFRSYRIGQSGLDNVAVTSAVGMVHPNDAVGVGAIGYLKASPDGSRLACAVQGLSSLEIFEFDNHTGVVKNPVILFISSWANDSYAVEFSPDGSKLYHTHIGIPFLFQYDLSAGTTQEIIDSETQIADNVWGSLQLGPDGKIYVAGRMLSNYLDVIHNPNEKGLSCNFERDAIHLAGASIWLGLPELIYDIIPADLFVDFFCFGDDTKFTLYGEDEISAVHWNFGDPNGENNEVDILSPTHRFSAPGTFTVVTIIDYNDGSQRTISTEVTILSLPVVELGDNKVICEGSSLILDVSGTSGRTYLWQDGTTSSLFSVTQAGTYSVTVREGKCENADTIQVSTRKKPEFDLDDHVLCPGQSVTISLTAADATVTWNDGFTGSIRVINTPGTYVVTALNDCGSVTRTMVVTSLPKLSVDLGEDRVICHNEKIELDAFSESADYKWSTGSEESKLTVDTEGTYSVDVFNACETLSDEIKVTVFKGEDLFIPNVLTPNGDMFNDRFEVEPIHADITLQIFNRWGKQVYETSSYNNTWKADGLAAGTYYYVMQERCSENTFRGWVQVIK